MSATGDLLTRLSELGEADREWILSRLSPSAKRRLLEDAQCDDEPAAAVVPVQRSIPAESSKPTDEIGELVAQASALTMHEVLRGDPDWFVAAVVCAGDWPWRDEFLRQWSGVLHLERSDGLPVLTMQMRQSILQATVNLLKAHVPAQPASRFESLLQRLSASRSRRRWSMSA